MKAEELRIDLLQWKTIQVWQTDEWLEWVLFFNSNDDQFYNFPVYLN